MRQARNLIGIILCASLLSAPTISIGNPPLRVAAASSLVPLLAHLSTQNLQITSAASGVLHAQITQGATYNILLTADPKYVNALEQAGLSKPEKRFCIANSGLVLAVAEGRTPSLNILTTPHDNASRLVIADPNLAPFGKAAIAVLNKNGGAERWGNSLIRARSAAQATQILVSGNAKYAILPPSLADEYNLPSTPIPTEWFQPVQYEAVILRGHSEATTFIEKLQSRTITTPGLTACTNV